MSDDCERSESGAPILDHTGKPSIINPKEFSAGHADAIIEHVTQRIGKPAWVFHEIISDPIHIDIHVVEPTPERNFYTLFTTGMSDRPMKTPEGAEQLQKAEILICLPPDWKLQQKDFEDESNYWPLRWLKLVARLPHQYNTWLWMGHTIPNGDPPEPLAPNTHLCSVLLAPPVCFDEDFCIIHLPDSTSIFFLSLIPLHRDELDFKLSQGMAALGEILDQSDVTEILNPFRPSLIRTPS